MMETSTRKKLRHSFSNFPKNIHSGIKSLFSHNFSENSVELWEKHITYIQNDERKRIWLPKYHYLTHISCDLFKRAGQNAKEKDHLGFAQHIDKKTYLPCDILTKVDIASMYHGLEVRVPLIDLQINKFAQNLPLNHRMGLNPANERTGKILLKNLLKPDFDNDFVFRNKMGFGIPRPIWFLPGHKAHEMLGRLLITQKDRLSNFFNVNRIQLLFEKHSLKTDYSAMLWLILVLCIWFEQNPDISFSKDSSNK